MANKRISSLDDITVESGTSSTAEVNANDILPITDVDDITGSPEGTTKGVKVSDLMGEAPVQSVAGRTGAVTISNTDVSGLGTAATTDSSDYATAAQGTKADSAVQPTDNVSTLTNDSGYITGVTAGELGDFDFDDNAIKGFSAEVPTEKTADHTLTNNDNGTVVVMNSSTAIKVIIPSGLATGFNCSVIQKGAGQVEFDNNSGASTINNRQSHTKINGQYGVASIVAYATDTYILAGDTAS